MKPNRTTIKMMTTCEVDPLVEIVDISKPISAHIQTKIDAFGNDADPFFIGDLGDIINKHKEWKKVFPRIEPFYSVKCNNLMPVLKLMADIGLSFDCASMNEIEQILKLGVDPPKIIYAHPCKQASSLVFARNKCVFMMTFDNEDELLKIKTFYPYARLVLRIYTPCKYKVTIHLSRKFGCRHSNTLHLLEVAKKLGLDVIGVSFHIGYGCLDTGAFEDAICLARTVFDECIDVGFNMYLLDIGGGIPGKQIPNFSFGKMAEGINQSLERNFPHKNIRIIAEPGQYYVTSAFSVATNIIGKRIVHSHERDAEKISEMSVGADKPLLMYYVNDGIHGNFHAAFRDPGCCIPLHFKTSDNCLYNSTIWGPTCDSGDIIIENSQLPEHNIGEWLYFKNMGAYSFAIANRFNSMQSAKQFFICERNLWEEVYRSDIIEKPVS